MSVITTIYSALEANVELRGLLSDSSINPLKKAIYDEWADNRTDFPYMVLSFSFSTASHFAKQETIFNVDIFTESDSITAENIKDEVILALDRNTFIDLDDGTYIRCYYNRDGQIVEPTDRITHWNVEMSLHHWRNTFIDRL